jgi:hypothetical protein
MKLTSRQLRQIINEELTGLICESNGTITIHAPRGGFGSVSIDGTIDGEQFSLSHLDIMGHNNKVSTSGYHEYKFSSVVDAMMNAKRWVPPPKMKAKLEAEEERTGSAPDSNFWGELLRGVDIEAKE